ncbi:MAG: ATP-binding protein [Pseudomonadota bacterium]
MAVFPALAHPETNATWQALRWAASPAILMYLVAFSVLAVGLALSVHSRNRVRVWAQRLAELEETIAPPGDTACHHHKDPAHAEAVGRLAGGVAHDFNNILAVVQGNLELLREGASIEEAQEMLEDAIGAAARGGVLTQQLLVYAGRARLQPESFDLGRATRMVVERIERRLPDRLSLIVEAETIRTKLDRRLYETALTHLIENAREAISDAGEIKVTLTWEADAEAPSVERRGIAHLRVTDTGRGMTDEVQAKATEPFFTTKHPAPASGMGLAVVAGFARQSGGDLMIESDVGRGTSVSVSLPLVSGMDEPALPARRPTVLIVEDEPSVRRALRRQLEAMGLDVTEAADGLAGLEAARDPLVSAMVVDLVLPGPVQGDDLVRRVRLDRPSMLVVFLSGLIDGDTRLAADDIALSKPVRREDLMAALSEILPAEAPDRS